MPHEITHLIFRDYVGFQGEVPVWLDEGVAQWEEPAKRKVVRSIMRFYLENGKGYSLEDLMSVDVRNMSARPAFQRKSAFELETCSTTTLAPATTSSC